MHPLYDLGKTDAVPGAIVIKDVSVLCHGWRYSIWHHQDANKVSMRTRKRRIAPTASKEAYFLKVIIRDKTQAFPREQWVSPGVWTPLVLRLRPTWERVQKEDRTEPGCRRGPFRQGPGSAENNWAVSQGHVPHRTETDPLKGTEVQVRVHLGSVIFLRKAVLKSFLNNVPKLVSCLQSYFAITKGKFCWERPSALWQGISLESCYTTRDYGIGIHSGNVQVCAELTLPKPRVFGKGNEV